MHGRMDNIEKTLDQHGILLGKTTSVVLPEEVKGEQKPAREPLWASSCRGAATMLIGRRRGACAAEVVARECGGAVVGYAAAWHG